MQVLQGTRGRRCVSGMLTRLAFAMQLCLLMLGVAFYSQQLRKLQMVPNECSNLGFTFVGRGHCQVCEKLGHVRHV